MKLVLKYTLLLGTTLAVVLSALSYLRMHYVREEIERDMRRDHRTVGHLLQVSVADIWLDTRDSDHATRETVALLGRASSDGPTRFSWVPGAVAPESQRVEDGAFVSRFPVRSGSRSLGTLVASESLHTVERTVRTHVWFNIAGIGTIVIVGLLAALLMGRWLVGKPIAILIGQARRIGQRDLASPIVLHRRDELGELSQELRAASETLAESLAKASAEAEARLAATEQLRHSERLSTVGRLAAGIAHELGTPLSIVGGHAQMIAGGEVTGDAGLASARAIDKEVTRMGKIVRQLLDFARRKGPEGTSCEAAKVAHGCVELLAVMADRARVRCVVECASPATLALIDEDSLTQVLTNLILNAVQAMPTGGAITVRITAADGAVRIAVSDTGAGIPDDIREHVFEPFFTTKPPGDGTGLGLSVVHGIVSDHGGSITIETGRAGTTFTVVLQEATT